MNEIHVTKYGDYQASYSDTTFYDTEVGNILLAAYLKDGFKLSQGYQPHPITGEPQYFANGQELDQAEAITWYKAKGLLIDTPYEKFDDDQLVMWKLRFC